MTWVSFMKPLGNSGRRGRSIWRQVRVAFSLGRDSRLMNPPGILPAAYMRSSMSTVSGKKSCVLARLFAGGGGHQDDGVSAADEDGAVGLLGEPAGLEGDRLAADLDFKCRHLVLRLPSVPRAGLRGASVRGDLDMSGLSSLESSALLAQLELFHEGAVALHVFGLQVVEQAPAVADHLQQTATRVVVFLVRLEVLGEVVDALGQERDLYFGRTGVAVVLGEAGDDLLFVVFGDCQGTHLPRRPRRDDPETQYRVGGPEPRDGRRKGVPQRQTAAQTRPSGREPTSVERRGRRARPWPRCRALHLGDEVVDVLEAPLDAQRSRKSTRTSRP